jgi:hypothetical protein
MKLTFHVLFKIRRRKRRRSTDEIQYPVVYFVYNQHKQV